MNHEERPEKGKFSEDETNFLKTHLPAYEALCRQLGEQATGPRGTGSVKGCKKVWVISKVFPEFVKQFSSDHNGGPQLQSLQAKVVRWFANHSPHRSLGLGPTATPQRPRATNGANMFAEEHKVRIKERMAEQQIQEGGSPEKVNLARYSAIKQDLYKQLSEQERQEYEAKATEKNKAHKAIPETSKIFENQENIVGRVAKALYDLIGWDWSQYGEVAFFVQGAYRNADNKLKTFNVSVSPNAKITNFSSTLPDYKEVIRKPFREWAENALPEGTTDTVADQGQGQGQKYAIDLQNGLPYLPSFDINLVAPNDARSMLAAYIELTWKFAIKTVKRSGLEVPWHLLDTASLRQKLLVNPEVFVHVKSLDPKRMSPHDVYDVLALLLQGQDTGVQLLEFSIKDIFNSDRDTEQEILDPQISDSEPPSPAAESLPLPLVPATSTVVDPFSQSSLPLSESIIKIAIENVAEAGYLRISDTTGIEAANQHLKKASTKRRREEIEQARQTKKHRSNLVVPTREQSSRLKDANYKNKHVTVRPR